MKTINNIRKSAGRLRMHAGNLLTYTLFTAIASGMAVQANAQTFSEWFKQKSTQKKYLLQQIAALEVYGGYLKKGYQIAGQGVGSISAYLLAENNLHQDFYQKLSVVSPLAKESPLVSEILSWQTDILRQLNSINGLTDLSANEKNYLFKVRQAVLDDCNQQALRLDEVLTKGELEMSDAERLDQIAGIHGDMGQNFRFVSGFTDQVRILCLQRRQEKNNVRTSKHLHAIQ